MTTFAKNRPIGVGRAPFPPLFQVGDTVQCSGRSPEWRHDRHRALVLAHEHRAYGAGGLNKKHVYTVRCECGMEIELMQSQLLKG